jgi:hypothetical protein
MWCLLWLCCVGGVLVLYSDAVVINECVSSLSKVADCVENAMKNRKIWYDSYMY